MRNKPSGSRERSHGFDMNRRTALRLGAAAGLIAVEELTLGAGRRIMRMLSGSNEALSDDSKAVEKMKYSYVIDGVTVSSNSVPEEIFLPLYARAKAITGGSYGATRNLHIEAGNLAGVDKDFEGTYIDKNGGTLGRTMYYPEKDMTEIIGPSDSLAHELVHYLLGPESKKWPIALGELIAGAASEHFDRFDYSDLDQSWIQMMTDRALLSGSPMTTPRYSALEMLAKRHNDKLPEVVRAAHGRADVTFENLADFLGGFGIDHAILHQGGSGEQRALVRFKQEGQDGFLFVRYLRVDENEERGFTGPVMAIFRSQTGREYTSRSTMEGVAFFLNPPQDFSPLLGIQIHNSDGYMTREF